MISKEALRELATAFNLCLPRRAKLLSLGVALAVEDTSLETPPSTDPTPQAEGSHTYLDEEGTTWTVPTAWAYAKVCKADAAKRKEILELEDIVVTLTTQLKDSRGAVAFYQEKMGPIKVEHPVPGSLRKDLKDLDRRSLETETSLEQHPTEGDIALGTERQTMDKAAERGTSAGRPRRTLEQVRAQAVAYLKGTGGSVAPSQLAKAISYSHDMRVLCSTAEFKLEPNGRIGLVNQPTMSQCKPLDEQQTTRPPGNRAFNPASNTSVNFRASLNRARDVVYAEIAMSNGPVTLVRLEKQLKYSRQLLLEVLNHPWFSQPKPDVQAWVTEQKVGGI